MSANVVYVTCGSAGAGHLVRGIAVGRALLRADSSKSFQLISAIAPLPAMNQAIAPFRPTTCAVDSTEVLDPDRAQGSALAQALREAKPDLLIVDLFWAPLIHLLPELACDAWLLVRSCPPIWLEGNASVRFDRRHYARVIGIEQVIHEEIREHIDPIVVCNPEDCRSRDEFCERFGIDPSSEIVVISHAGLPGEINALKQVEKHPTLTEVRCDLHTSEALFPLAPWLPGVDRIHCSAGYNSYWESKWLGYDNRTTFSVFRRKIDDPMWRVKTNRDVMMRQNGADILATMIEQG